VALELRTRLAVGNIEDEGVSRAAFQDARNERVRCAFHYLDFGFETVFSHGSNLAFLRALRQLGYEVHLYFVATEDPSININVFETGSNLAAIRCQRTKFPSDITAHCVY
jgi:hypothetical protein